MALWHLKLSASIGYSAAIVFGVPLYFFVLKRKGWKGLSHYALCGLGIGIGAYFIPFIVPIILEGSLKGLKYAIGSTLPFAFLSMLLGALSASVFWLIAIRSTTRQ